MAEPTDTDALRDAALFAARNHAPMILSAADELDRRRAQEERARRLVTEWRRGLPSPEDIANDLEYALDDDDQEKP